MTDIVYPPCFIIPDPCKCSGVDFSDPANAEVIARAKLGVAQMFYSATHGKYSCCTDRVYPCVEPTKCESEHIEYLLPYYSIPYLNLDTGVLKNCMPCRCETKSSCECTVYPSVVLPAGVTSVTGVFIGGVDVYSDTTFWLDGNVLYTSLPGGFPTCNSLKPGDPDSWWVEFKRGYNPPAYALDLLANIVCERVKQCLSLPCSPGPSTSRVIESNGQVFVVDDTKLVWQNGLTGYHQLDNWIVSDRGGLGRAYLAPRGVRSGSDRKVWL